MNLDIFNGDAFSLESMTTYINAIPVAPSLIADMGLFAEEGIYTTMVSIEYENGTLSLVPAQARGGVRKPVTLDPRKARPFSTVHLPQGGAVLADEALSVRAFGKQTELDLATDLVNRKLKKMRAQLDATIEYQRLGAIKGVVYDADGSTVLLDIFTAFGVTQTVIDMNLDSDATKVMNVIRSVSRAMEDAIGAGQSFTGITVFCSPTFFDALASHPAVEKAFALWNNGQFMRQDNRKGFPFGGSNNEITWVEVRGRVGEVVGGIPFIDAGSAYAVPTGVADLFQTKFAPGDYMGSVGTLGLPYYSSQERMPHDKGISLESQSNPLNICTRPGAILKLTLT